MALCGSNALSSRPVLGTLFFLLLIYVLYTASPRLDVPFKEAVDTKAGSDTKPAEINVEDASPPQDGSGMHDFKQQSNNGGSNSKRPNADTKPMPDDLQSTTTDTLTITTASPDTAPSFGDRPYAEPSSVPTKPKFNLDPVSDGSNATGINVADSKIPDVNSTEDAPTSPILPLSTCNASETGLPLLWEFDVKKHGQNFGLSDAQCSAAFPKMYIDIETMVTRFKEKPIRKEQLESQGLDGPKFKAMVYEGELFILSDSGLESPGTRGMATAHAINRALIAYPDRAELPNCEFMIYTQDLAPRGEPVWAYSKKLGSEYEEEYENMWMMPDFGFYSWPEPKVGSYGQVRRGIKAVEEKTPFEEKVQKLVWRGTNFEGNHARNKFVNITRDRSWADVKALDWNDSENIKQNLLPIPDHCRYMFIGHIAGHSWSAQGKYIHHCHSVFVTHASEWTEIYKSALISSGLAQNYVQAKTDWSDLEEIIEDLLANPKKARLIADNSARTLRDRYLTPAAEACYWRKLIQGYGSVSFEPDFYKNDNKTWRGVPFESLALTRKVEWEAH